MWSPGCATRTWWCFTATGATRAPSSTGQAPTADAGTLPQVPAGPCGCLLWKVTPEALADLTTALRLAATLTLLQGSPDTTHYLITLQAYVRGYLCRRLALRIRVALSILSPEMLHGHKSIAVLTRHLSRFVALRRRHQLRLNEISRQVSLRVENAAAQFQAAFQATGHTGDGVPLPKKQRVLNRWQGGHTLQEAAARFRPPAPRT